MHKNMCGLQHALWIAAALIAAPTYAADKKCELQQLGQLPVTMSGTRPLISGTVNGKPARFLADSGAFFSMITRSSAERFGLKPGALPPNLTVRGVGGVAHVGLSRADEFTLDGFVGGRVFKDVEFLVSSGGGGGVDGLIGQNVIGVADAEYDLANGVIRIFRPKDCSGRNLAYWQREGSVAELEIDPTTPSSPHIVAAGRINGKRIRVMFDSGAWRSVLNIDAAERAGVAIEDEEVKAAGVTRGIGKQSIETYLARFDTLDLGGEVIKNAKLRIADIEAAKSADMLLGADFFLSHRIYIALKQRKMYFTYNGGQVFDLRRSASDRTMQAATPPPDTAENTASTLSARELRLRGAASTGRLDYVNAIADFDQAIKLDPNDADAYFERAKAYWGSGRPRLAHEDVTKAIALNASHTQALIMRANLELRRNRAEAAKADFDAALKSSADPANLALEIGHSYVGAGQFAEAIPHLTTWIDAHPRDNRLGAVLNDRCWARAMANVDLELALQDCNAALKKGDRNSMVLDSRAFLYLRTGKYDLSIKDYQAVLKLQPKKALSLYGLGLAKIRKGLKDEGERDIQAALALEPRIAAPFERVGIKP